MPKKDRTDQVPSRDFPRPQEGEIICVVKKMLGAEHIIIACLDGKERTARIPGRMRKKTWIKEGDVILAAPWDFQPNKADVVYKYMNDEIKKLIEEKVISRDVIDQLRG